MAHQNSDSSTNYDIANKPIAVKVYFWDPQQRYGFINIDPVIINSLNIDSETILTQEITEEGILLRRLRRLKEDI